MSEKQFSLTIIGRKTKEQAMPVWQATNRWQIQAMSSTKYSSSSNKPP